jgi:hypothetical protein
MVPAGVTPAGNQGVETFAAATFVGAAVFCGDADANATITAAARQAAAPSNKLLLHICTTTSDWKIATYAARATLARASESRKKARTSHCEES